MKLLPLWMCTLCFIPLLFHFQLNAQWQPDVRLTNDPASSSTSENNAWCVAANGNVVHLVWYDNRDGNDEVYYKRSTDGGTSWGADTRLTNDPAHSRHSSIAVSDQNIHVVWHDIRDGNDEIYYKHSTDGGTNWEADIRLTENSSHSYIPVVSVSDQIIHVVWVDWRDGGEEIYYKRSGNGGMTWEADIRISNNIASSYYPTVSSSGLVVLTAWQDYREGNTEIFYRRSLDGGVNWGDEIRLTNNSAMSTNPSVVVAGQMMHVVWQDNRDLNREIYYKSSADDGVNWGPDVRLTNNVAQSRYPSLALSDSCLHVVWHDDRNGNEEIYYKRSTNLGVDWEADLRLTNDTGVSFNPSLSIASQTVHVVWTDSRDGNDEIYYKQNPTGSPTGIKRTENTSLTGFDLYQNFPNPFNPTTVISWQLVVGSWVRLTIYDLTGREVAVLVNERQLAGNHQIKFDASDLPGGVYCYRLQAGESVQVRKAVLLK